MNKGLYTWSFIQLLKLLGVGWLAAQMFHRHQLVCSIPGSWSLLSSSPFPVSFLSPLGLVPGDSRRRLTPPRSSQVTHLRPPVSRGPELRPSTLPLLGQPGGSPQFRNHGSEGGEGEGGQATGNKEGAHGAPGALGVCAHPSPQAGRREEGEPTAPPTPNHASHSWGQSLQSAEQVSYS